MTRVNSLAEVKARPSELVALVGAQHERITVTVHGRPLLDNPHRVGKQLRAPLGDRHSARRGTYRVVYRIDDERHRVEVLGVFSRADAYRRR